MSQLVTGEAVSLDLRPAALPSRLIAGLIDAGGQAAVLLVFGGIATAVSLDVSEAAAQALSILVLVSVLIVYPVTFETLLRGRTPGKAAMGLRVVRDDGGPVGFRQSLVRGLAGAFLERPGITLFVAGVVSSLSNAQGKRLGDLLAGTVVLRERVPVKGGVVAQMPPPLAGWAAGLDLSGLSNELALSVRQFVSRSGQLTPAAREELGGRLVRAVTDVVGPAPAGTPGWAVLAAVLAERRRRETDRLAARPGRERSATATSSQAQAQAQALQPTPPPAPTQAQTPTQGQAPVGAPPVPGAGGFAPPA